MKDRLISDDSHIPRLIFQVVRLRGVTRSRVLDTSMKIAHAAYALIPDDGREHFGVFMLTSSLRCVGYHEVAVGSVDGVESHPREILGAVLRTPCVTGIVCVHNHPSGDVQPSKADVRNARDIQKASALLGVRLIDYLIIGDHGEGRRVSKLYSFDIKRRLKK